jgi:hypothetical protein
MLNIIFAVFLMLMSVYMGWYAAVLPMTTRALAQVRARAETDLELKRQDELRAIDQAEKTAKTTSEKAELDARRKAFGEPRKLALPIGMDLKAMGMGGPRFTAFTWIDALTGILFNVGLLVAGIGLLRRELWGLRLAIATAAAKIIRLLLLYSYAVLAIVPPMAQGTGKMVAEMMLQQAKMTGGPTPPPMMNPAFFTKIYYVMYTVMAVGMMLFGAIYPAISLWFLTRPGARAACEPRARQYQQLPLTRALGITNIVFASCLIFFGLSLGAYIAALPVLGRTLAQVQKKTEEASAARQKAELKEIAEAEAKATTDEEKEELAGQRKAIESRPKPPNPFMALDLGQMGLDDPKLLTYYWLELTTGLLLNAAMITAGIGLLRQKPWGMTLGSGTAALKMIRLVVVYGYFAVSLAPLLAGKMAAMMGKMMAQQQAIFSQGSPMEFDTGPLRETYTGMYPPIAVAFIVLGSIYPAVSLWLLLRARAHAAAKKTAPPAPELTETW